MPEASFEGLAIAGLVMVAGLALAAFNRGRVRWGWFAAAIVLMVLQDLFITRFYGAAPSLFDSRWNWEGKLMAAALSLAVASLSVVGWRRTGLTLRHHREHLRGALLFAGAVAALFLGLALYFPGQGADLDTLAFQLTMPGVEEELFYRGVLLLMFNEAFDRPVRVLGAPMGWGALLSSLAFGLVHALDYGAGGFSFDGVAMAITGLSGLLLVWLREKTGSLLLPIVMHNYGNAIFLFV